jgi:nicotinamide-nucleotide adenylyltransferase
MPEYSPYSTALVVGRFQPFHNGHLHLLREALSLADTVVIAVGSSNVQNDDNPLTFEQRREMLQLVIENEGWEDRIQKIVPAPDFPDDQEWLNTLIHNAGEFQIALGNNEWTNAVLAQAGYDVRTIPFLERDTLEGTQIRDRFRTQKDWQERVPQYLHEFVKKRLV